MTETKSHPNVFWLTLPLATHLFQSLETLANTTVKQVVKRFKEEWRKKTNRDITFCQGSQGTITQKTRKVLAAKGSGGSTLLNGVEQTAAVPTRACYDLMECLRWKREIESETDRTTTTTTNNNNNNNNSVFTTNENRCSFVVGDSTRQRTFCVVVMQLFNRSSGMRLPGFITFTSAPHIVCHSCSPFSAMFYNKIT